MEDQPEIYSVKITLRGSKPKVWRRVLVDSTSTLTELHEVIQYAMGWIGYHLHQFKIGGKFFQSNPLDEDFGFFGMEVHNGDEVRLNEVAEPGSKFIYEYDFGDGWEHEIFVEKVVPFKPSLDVPSCTGGACACPPEDCGGIYGYANLIKTMAGPDSEEKRELTEWLDEMSITRFDPKEFDKDLVNGQTLWTAGEPAEIRWQLKPNNSKTDLADITLVGGDYTAYQPIQLLGANVVLGIHKLPITKVPDVSCGSSCALQFFIKDGPGKGYYYTHNFTIAAPGATPATTTSSDEAATAAPGPTTQPSSPTTLAQSAAKGAQSQTANSAINDINKSTLSVMITAAISSAVAYLL
ncbi:hypothetical protein BGZ80_001149 [Entomortierella chlamydospora]|uniref:Plasmid pRiA4b Orf3-like domain-containing protein n=1 Tax=Entomortierella chlamydospora TaxID=101097 RepID=A0A9P6MRL9_9FUNG|nr:hypothetical protein BGZ80_001149 [Entomortierella chlamydospora]